MKGIEANKKVAVINTHYASFIYLYLIHTFKYVKMAH